MNSQYGSNVIPMGTYPILEYQSSSYSGWSSVRRSGAGLWFAMSAFRASMWWLLGWTPLYVLICVVMWLVGFHRDDVIPVGTFGVLLLISIFVYLLSSAVQDNYNKRLHGYALVARTLGLLVVFASNFKTSTKLSPNDVKETDAFNVMATHYRNLAAAWVRAVQFAFKGTLDVNKLELDPANREKIEGKLVDMRMVELDEENTSQTLAALSASTLEFVSVCSINGWTWKAKRINRNINDLYLACRKLVLYRTLAFPFFRREIGNVALFVFLFLVSIMSVVYFGYFVGYIPTILIVYLSAGIWVSSFRSIAIWENNNAYAMCGDMSFDDLVGQTLKEIDFLLDKFSADIKDSAVQKKK